MSNQRGGGGFAMRSSHRHRGTTGGKQSQHPGPLDDGIVAIPKEGQPRLIKRYRRRVNHQAMFGMLIKGRRTLFGVQMLQNQGPGGLQRASNITTNAVIASNFLSR